MKVHKAVITAAGKGSRVKHMSTFMPKALLPLYSTEEGKKTILPIVNIIIDSLHSSGVSKLCLVVGKHKNVLMDYLFDVGPTFVFQNEPKGFGDAVLRAKDFVGSDAVVVHADDGVLTGGYKEAISLFEKKSADAVLLLRWTENPSKKGVAEVAEEGEFEGYKLFVVKGVEEKPAKPKSNYMLSAVYVFSNKVFEKLEEIKGQNKNTGEFELTDGIKKLIEDGGRVYGLFLKDEEWLNVGDPESYYRALQYSYKNL